MLPGAATEAIHHSFFVACVLVLQCWSSVQIATETRDRRKLHGTCKFKVVYRRDRMGGYMVQARSFQKGRRAGYHRPAALEPRFARIVQQQLGAPIWTHECCCLRAQQQLAL